MVLVVLVVEGFFVYRWYERYDGPAAASDATIAGSAASPKAGERTAPGIARGAGGVDSPAEAEFAHAATDENSRGDYTYLSDPSIDGDPNAIILAAPSRSRAVAGGAAYGHNIGVWFEPGARRWAVFNQDRAPVPPGSTFEVLVPREPDAFVHRAGPANTVGNSTYIDNPLVNGEPNERVSVTQNWNPGGGGGVYNDHPVGALYDEDVDRWAVYNRDGGPMPGGASFNVAVPGAAGPAG